MNRGYTRERYLELIAELRAAYRRSRCRPDLIVGFPGETETDFAATLDMVERVATTTSSPSAIRRVRHAGRHHAGPGGA